LFNKTTANLKEFFFKNSKHNKCWQIGHYEETNIVAYKQA